MNTKTKKRSEHKAVLLRLPTWLYAAIRRRAKLADLTVTAWIRHAVKIVVNDEDNEDDRKLKRKDGKGAR